ncbi:MAG: VCBS repeat-containing protein [Abyssibacter sp.]|uniref:FG-GAP repeat domain-containing protein n=1 Tax=Abyssibacter sp. TaxID=2320200 RepID=UPI00321A35BE
MYTSIPSTLLRITAGAGALAAGVSLSACSGGSAAPGPGAASGPAIVLTSADRYLASVGGNGPAHGGVAAGDMNADGYPDVVVTDSIGNAVAILLNGGDGSLLAAERYVAGLQPVAVIVEDLSGDGVLDVAVTNARSDDVQVYHGQGDGTIAQVESHAAGLGPTDLAAADVDGDGDLDLLSYWGDVTILINDGQGRFSPGAPLVTGEVLGAIAIGMDVADFDGDGAVDVAITDWPRGPVRSRVEIFYGAGDGSFTSGAGPFELSGATEAMRTADMNCDGRQDLLIPIAGGSLAVAYGQADGRLAEPVEFETDSGSNAVLFSDFDRDGRLDLAVSYFNGYAGLFYDVCSQDFTSFVEYDTVETSEAMVAPDLNLDGFPDLVVGTWYQPQIAVLLSGPSDDDS